MDDEAQLQDLTFLMEVVPAPKKINMTVNVVELSHRIT